MYQHLLCQHMILLMHHRLVWWNNRTILVLARHGLKQVRFLASATCFSFFSSCLLHSSLKYTNIIYKVDMYISSGNVYIYPLLFFPSSSYPCTLLRMEGRKPIKASWQTVFCLFQNNPFERKTVELSDDCNSRKPLERCILFKLIIKTDLQNLPESMCTTLLSIGYLWE